MTHDISKNAEMIASNGMSDFGNTGASSTDVNIPKKTKSPVINKIQKLTLMKSVTPKNSVKENSVLFTRQR